MVVIVSALAGMAARAGQNLSGSRVEDTFADGMREYAVLPMAFAADSIDWCLEHGRLIRAMGRMTIIAGICHQVAEFCFIVTLESCFMAFVADVTFLSFEQPLIITGVW
jgi:hypothetical protein